MRKVFWPEVILIGLIALFEVMHVYVLFGDGSLLAGGDNYTYLQIGNTELNLYTWDQYLPFGGRNFALPAAMGIPLISRAFSFLQPALLQRILIFALYLFKYIGFIKLAKYVGRKFSVFALIPAIIVYVFNVFESLNPFSLYPLMYGVYLPFSLYYFLKLYESTRLDFRNISKLLLLSFVFTAINANLPLSVTIFVPQILFVALSIKSLNKARILNVCLYYVLWVLVNVWWLIPLVSFYFETAAGVIGGGRWFSAASAGSMYANFRFLGQWAWYAGHYLAPYYPFSVFYDRPLVILVTYAIVILSFVGGLVNKNGGVDPKYRLFFVLLGLSSLFFVGGSRPPFGLLYELVFNIIPGFKVFREPFTKFGELYVVSISILFYLFLSGIEKYLYGLKKFVLFAVFVTLTIIGSLPVITGEHVWDIWNGSSRTFRVDVPGYWREFGEFLKAHSKDSRILTIPRSYYGSAWNWPRGFSSADDVAINFVSGGNSIVRNPLAIYGYSDLVDEIFRTPNLNAKYLSLLGIDYILQENDLDWRYSGDLAATPEQNDLLSKRLGLKKIVEFGNFALERLLRIPNNEPRVNLAYEMYVRLLGRPNLIFYGLDKLRVLPKIYASNDYVFGDAKLSALNDLAGFGDYRAGSGVYIYPDYDVPDSRDMLDAAYYVFVEGVRQNRAFAGDYLAWNKGWLWPEVNVDPSDLSYKLVFLKEYFSLLFAGGGYHKKIDLIVWFSSKRISELMKYDVPANVKERLLGVYDLGMRRVVGLIKSIPATERDENYWETVRKALAYMERGVGLLGFDVTPAMNNLYVSFKAWVEDEANVRCGDVCFEVKVPETGEYKIDVGDIALFELTARNDRTDEAVYKLKRDEGDEGGGYWFDAGKAVLESGESYTFNVLVPAARNLLSRDEWLSYKGIGEETPFALNLQPQDIVPGYKFLDDRGLEGKKILVLWSEHIKYKPIEGWDAQQKYKISFDYNVYKGGLGYSVVEEFPDYKGNFDRIQRGLSVDDSLRVKEISLNRELDSDSLSYKKPRCGVNGGCLYHYEKEILSKRDARGALLFIYAFPDAGELSDVRVENVKIEKIETAKLVLVKTKSKKAEVPGVTFEKVNPTKYKVRIEGAKAPFTLIFDESFHKLWSLSFDGKQIAGNRHYKVNGFANSWFVTPDDTAGSENYELTLEFLPQNLLHITFVVSGTVLALCLAYLAIFEVMKFVKKYRSV
ncbi:hypothetical protein HYW61_01565 [candidate division WWE3 bacterium]|nr:hypothetical protein [candidate division WWE3 bacterium]